MIALTRLNGSRFVLNAELIRTIEERPDTVIMLINGDHIVVRESLNEVVARSIDYRRHLHTFLGAEPNVK
ncbi:MAG: flagellar FlbD family protein [Phycisphaeraceae bacterium]|nr:flagellar FlbD family protein [Phycisphaeraceae bacterium]MCW5755149.1 flagellar FlbD family protein [Phycisphaeraceae bacterium]